MNERKPGLDALSAVRGLDAGTDAGAELEARAVAVLEAAPAVRVPTNFATRVAALAVAGRTPVRSRWSGFGMRAALGSGVLLTGALFACAPHALPSFGNLRFDLELLFLAELGGVAYLVTRLGSQE